MRTVLLGVCAAVLLLTACGSPPPPGGSGDAHADGESLDTGAADSAYADGAADSTTETDASQPDAAPQADATASDATVSDGASSDGTLADAIAHDAGSDAELDAHREAAADAATDAGSEDAHADASSCSVTCGPHQTCTPSVDGGSCTCEVDSACTIVGDVCASTTAPVSCKRDPQGCLYGTPLAVCTGGTTCLDGVCACNGLVVDLNNDPLNCGSCGNVCPAHLAGQTCAGGVCQPYAIAGLSPPYDHYDHLVSDGTYLYATSPNESFAAYSVFEYTASTGNLVNSLLLDGVEQGLLTDGINVYWFGWDTNDLGFIDYVPNGQLDVVSPTYALEGSSFVPVDGNIDSALGKLFFGTMPAPGQPKPTVAWIPLPPAAALPTVLANPVGWAQSTEQPSVAADATQFYWAGPRTGADAGGLYAEPVDGGVPRRTLSSSTNIEAFRQSGGYLYYLDRAGGSLMRVPTGGSTATPLASISSAASNLALDAHDAYWVDGSSIKSVPLAGGSVTDVAPFSFGGLLTVDAVALYWVDGGTIMRLPK
jgi:hypothetical protein